MSPTPTGPGPAPGQFDYSQYTGQGSTAVAQESARQGGGGSDIFIPEVIGTFPHFKPSEGMKLFDIIMAPAGKKHPAVVSGKIAENAMVHTVWAYIHKNLGAGQGWYICPARTYGRRCPACEERSRIMANAGLTNEQVKVAIKPYNSGMNPLGLYNAIFHTNPNPQQLTWAEPVMYFDITYAYMEKILQNKANSEGPFEDPPTGYINYFWPTPGAQGGRHIKVDITKDGEYFKYGGHAFFKRAVPIPAHVMQQGRCLSDFLYIGNDFDSLYDEIKQAVDVVVEGQKAGQEGAGAPTGAGTWAGPESVGQPQAGYSPPAAAPQVFGAPPAHQGQFPECTPLGSKYWGFNECQSCPQNIRVNCYNAAPPDRQALSPVPGVAATAPAPATPMEMAPAAPAPGPNTGPGTAPAPETAAPPPPPGAPIPRRVV